MKKILTTIITLFTLLLCSCSLSQKNGYSYKIAQTWKFKTGTNASWADPKFNDSEWKELAGLDNINFDTTNNSFWVRTTIKIPADLQNQDIYLAFKKFNAAVDVYADGVYIGSRGSISPKVNIKIQNETDILIPQPLIKNNSVKIALKFFLPGKNLTDPDLYLDNGPQAYFQNTIKFFFNQELFVLMAVASIFFIFYSFLQYIVDTHDVAYLYFIISVSFVALYLYELGATVQLFDYNTQHALFRSFLSVGMLFIYPFINRFYNQKYYKIVKIVTPILALIDVSLFLVNRGNDLIIEDLFFYSLFIVIGGVIYGIICAIIAIKNGHKDCIPIFIGFILGTAIAAHDIYYQTINVTPFMWIQGIAFFVLDLAVFITLAIRQLNSKHSIEKLAIATDKQKISLKQIIENAKNLANDSNSIANELNNSVESVVQVTNQTLTKIKDIDNALQEQSRVREETNKAVLNLTDFLNYITKEFESETQIITKTVNQTQQVIKEFNQVGEGIYSAEEFSTSLSDLTKASTTDTNNLLHSMEQIQESSNEILNVITTLDNFAHRIDLLAMNAGIEAAHSGEAGKGFAVIAHEIKKLASQTQQWSAKIADIISSVIVSIDESVALTQKVNSTITKINEESVLSAEKIHAASKAVKIQEEAGTEINNDSQTLYKSANKMQEEVLKQSNFSELVLQNMKSLFAAADSVEKATNAIEDESEKLSLEAAKLGEIAKHTTQSAQQILNAMADKN